MTSLTLDQLNNQLPSPPSNMKDSNSLSLDDLNKIPPPVKRKLLSQIGLGVEAGLAETAAGTSKLLSLALPDWLTEQARNLSEESIQELGKKAEKLSKQKQEEINKTQNNLPAEITAGITHLGTSSALTAPFAEVAPEALLANRAAWLKRAVKSIPQGAAFGAISTQPNQSVTSGAVTGAILSPFGSVAGDMLGSLLSSITEYGQLLNIERESEATTPEIEQAIKSAKGTTPLAGEALKNPEVNRLEKNFLPYFYKFKEQARNKIKNMAALVINQSNDLYNRLTVPMSKQERSEATIKAFKDNESSLQKQKRQLFKTYNDIADSLDEKVVPSNLAKAAEEDREEFSKLSKTFGVESNAPGMAALNKILDTIFEKQKEPTKSSLILPPGLEKNIEKKLPVLKTSDFDTANFAVSALNDLAYEASLKQEPGSAAIFSRLADSLRKDVNEAIERSGNEDLKNAHKAAYDFYKENIVPLMDAKVWKILRGKVDPDTIIKGFFPTGDKGRLNLLNQLLKNAPGTEKIILTEILSNARHENKLGQFYTNPAELDTLFNKIGMDRLKLLVKNQNDLKDIQDFRNNIDNANDVLNVMFTPKTGYANVANINFYENGKIAKETLDDALDGKFAKLVSRLATISGRLALSKAINNPQLLQNIVKLRLKQSVPQGFHRLATLSRLSGIPMAQLLTFFINSNQ